MNRRKTSTWISLISKPALDLLVRSWPAFLIFFAIEDSHAVLNTPDNALQYSVNIPKVLIALDDYSLKFGTFLWDYEEEY